MAKDRPISKDAIKAAADRAFGIAPDDPADKGGRPSSYQPEFAEQARKLCELGATDIEVADFFDVSGRTIYRWQLKYPEFCQALKAGKDIADERVERSLYHKATGYTYEAEKVFQYQGEIVRAKVREHIPPDTTSMIFWLKNRRPDAWRDVHKVEHGNAGDFDKMTDDELREFVTGRAGNEGKGKARPLAERGRQSPVGKPH